MLIILLARKKTLSTIVMLSFSGLVMLFLVSFDSSDQSFSSEMALVGIPETFENLMSGSNELSSQDFGRGNTMALNSCSTANMIIGKNGIAKCNP